LIWEKKPATRIALSDFVLALLASQEEKKVRSGSASHLESARKAEMDPTGVYILPNNQYNKVTPFNSNPFLLLFSATCECKRSGLQSGRAHSTDAIRGNAPESDAAECNPVEQRPKWAEHLWPDAEATRCRHRPTSTLRKSAATTDHSEREHNKQFDQLRESGNGRSRQHNSSIHDGYSKFGHQQLPGTCTPGLSKWKLRPGREAL
jgi:hypothetical protein